MSKEEIRKELLELKSTFDIRAEQYEISAEERTDQNDKIRNIAMSRAYDHASDEVKSRIDKL